MPQNLKFLLLNAQSFAATNYDLSTLTSVYNIDILCLNETWENKNSNIPMSLPNYRCFLRPGHTVSEYVLGIQTRMEEWQFSSNKMVVFS